MLTAIIAVTNMRLVWNSRKAHQRELRAYVTAIDGTIEVLPLRDGGYSAKGYIILENQGKTPAYSFRTLPKIQCGPSETPLFEPNPAEPEDWNTSIIGSGQRATANLTSCHINQDQLTAVRNGEQKIYVSLRAEYKDVLGKQRFFLARITNGERLREREGQAKRENRGLIFSWQISPHQLGYDAD